MLPPGRYKVIMYVNEASQASCIAFMQSFFINCGKFPLTVVMSGVGASHTDFIKSYDVSTVYCSAKSVNGNIYNHYSLIPFALRSSMGDDFVLLLSPDTVVSSDLTGIFSLVVRDGYHIPTIVDNHKNEVPDAGCIGLNTKHALFQKLVGLPDDCSYDDINNTLNPFKTSVTYKARKRLYHPTEDAMFTAIREHVSYPILRYNRVFGLHQLKYSSENSVRLYGVNNGEKIVVCGHGHLLAAIANRLRNEAKVSVFHDESISPHGDIDSSYYSEDIIKWWNDENIPYKVWLNPYFYKHKDLIEDLRPNRILCIEGDPIMEVEHICRNFHVPIQYKNQLPGDLQHLVSITNRYDGRILCNDMMSYLYNQVVSRSSVGEKMDLRSFMKTIGSDCQVKIPDMNDWATQLLSPHYRSFISGFKPQCII